jgi:outer membrane biosynthesis protein TonB
MYIQKKAHPAARAYENKKMGTTYVSFVIEPDGNVSNVCTILAAGYGMDEEAVRVISQSNHWIPATLNNKPVRCFCRAAIKFFSDFDQHSTLITAVRVE